MKYLKAYESFSIVSNTKKMSFSDFYKKPEAWSKSKYYYSIKHTTKLDLYHMGLLDLNGIEKYTNLEELHCAKNDLENLHGIENLTKLKYLDCRNNELKNLDEIKNLKNLENLYFIGNSWEYPLDIEIIEKFPQLYNATNGFNTHYLYYEGNEILSPYRRSEIQYFISYDFQKDFLTKFPERLKDLEPIGYAKGIKEEFPALFTGKEWGFFDLERSEQ